MIAATEYTFFPDREEREGFVTCTPEELADVVEHQPDMSARFLHELWRTKRNRVAYEGLRRMSQDGRHIPAEDFFDDLVTSSAMMCSMGGVDQEGMRTFVSDAVELVSRAANDFPLEDPLPPAVSEELTSMKASIVNAALSMYRQYKARTN